MPGLSKTTSAALLLCLAARLSLAQSATLRLTSDDSDGYVNAGEVTTWTLWIEFENAAAAESGNFSLVAEDPGLLASSDFVYTPANGGSNFGTSDGAGGIERITWTNALFLESFGGAPPNLSNPYPVGTFTTTALRSGPARYRMLHEPPPLLFLTLGLNAFTSVGLHESQVPFEQVPLSVLGLDPGGTEEPCEVLGFVESQGFGVNGTVRTAETLRSGDVVIAGRFESVSSDSSSSVPARGVARFDGEAWHAYGEGLEGIVYAVLELPSGDLLAGGNFEYFYGSGVMRWDGRSWLPVGEGFSGGAVYALAALPGGRIVAGGGFRSTPSVPRADNLSIFRGGVWETFGGGISGTSVRTLLVTPDGNLIVGGDFYRAGSERIDNIARWSRNRWEPMGDTLGIVTDLVYSPDGRLVASGEASRRTDENGYYVYNSVFEWDGQAWQRFGGADSGYGFSGQLQFLETGTLIASGYALKRWDGSAWQALVSSYISHPVIPTGNDSFIVASSTGLAFGPMVRPPSIALQPERAVAACVQDRVRVETFAVGPGPISYRWQQIDVDSPDGWRDLANGFDPELGEIAGADAHILWVTGLDQTTQVRCVVSNGCASVTTNPARLRRRTIDCCALADFDGDGFLTPEDLSLFVEYFLSDNPEADLNNDLVLDLGDIDALVQIWLAGCE